MNDCTVRIQQVLAASLGDGRHICRIDKRPSPYRSSFFVDEIDVTLDDGSTFGLIAKSADGTAMSAEAQQAKPLFLRNDERERAIYESILARLELNTPRFFGSYVDGSGVPYLLLERVDGVPIWQCSDLEVWRQAARWLAHLHSRRSLHVAASGRAAAHLIGYDRDYYDRWMQRACEFHLTGPGEVAALARRFPAVVEWLLDEPTVFIHGEFYPSNVIVSPGEAQGSVVVRPLDWETGALGPALVDLACLVAGRWTDADRADVTDAYFAELASAGGHVPSRRHYLKTLDCCLIHLSVRNLGWSADWSPPPDRSHDWLHDAMRLCDKWRF